MLISTLTGGCHWAGVLLSVQKESSVVTCLAYAMAMPMLMQGYAYGYAYGYAKYNANDFY